MEKYKNISFKKEIDGLNKIINQKNNDFFDFLLEKFYGKWLNLLNDRKKFDEKIKNGKNLDFLAETKDIRDADWRVSPIPADLLNRKVEITGPVDRKMIINGLNSGAMVYMADFEDSQSPTWSGMINGQVNLYDAVRRDIDFTNKQGKRYELKEKTALLLVRPRGLHLEEKNVLFKDKVVPASLFDFAYYFCSNVEEWLKQGKGIYFYLPKLEHYQEAKFWQEVFQASEEYFNLPTGTIKVTVLIETITAVFQMHEILHAFKDYCVGLNCGRWDYIFSYIKKQSHLSDKILPDRSEVNMSTPFLRSYSKLLIDTCHQRGVLAMGGMAAQIPIKNDEEKNQTALEKVRQDKEREAKTGHDGTWVAHPGLVPLAKDIFSSYISGDNQLTKRIPEAKEITADDLLETPKREMAKITLDGLQNNIKVSLHYLAAWLSGNGCVPINYLMEDLATAEIARAQLWQWLHHENVYLDSGEEINQVFFEEEFEKIFKEFQTNSSLIIVPFSYYEQAAKILKEIILNNAFTDFLSKEGYAFLD